jgi:hypothetical protein
MLGLALTGCAGGASHLVYDDEDRLITQAKKMLKLGDEQPPKKGFPADIKPLPRSSWAPYPPIKKRLDRMTKIFRVTVHHQGSDVNTHTSRWSVAADLQDIRRIHLRTMHAGDIGYHYIIDRAGRVWEGRPVCYQGAHCGGASNIGNLGIMCLGNFDRQRPTAKQLAILDRFLRHQMKVYSVPMKKVYTHREFKPTRCPGKYLQYHMNKFRA